MCARYQNFVVHLRTSRALSERFLSRWHDSVNSISSHTMSTLSRSVSYAYRTVHWDVNLHLNRWSPSAHVCKVREFRGTSAHFQSTFRLLFKQVTWICLTLLALTGWVHFPKYSYAYRTVHRDVNLHLNRWSPSAHVCKVREFRRTSAHFQSTFRALLSRWLDSVNSISSHTMSTLSVVFLCIQNCSLGCKLAFEQVISFCACVQGTRISWYICALPEHFQSAF